MTRRFAKTVVSGIVKTAQAWIRQRDAELDNPKAFKAATHGVKTLGEFTRALGSAKPREVLVNATGNVGRTELRKLRDLVFNHYQKGRGHPVQRRLAGTKMTGGGCRYE